MSEVIYLNGEFVPYKDAKIHVEDRGNTYADGIYEVIRFYNGKPLELIPHFQRLVRSAASIRLAAPPIDELVPAALECVKRNKIGDGTIYIQVTRGVAPRRHAFPKDVPSTVFMVAQEVSRPDPKQVAQGVACITVPDIRWQRCNIKSIALLANVLAKQQAVEADAYEAIFVRDGTVTEGSSSNAWAVQNGEIWTHPADWRILGGITRDCILKLAKQQGITVNEEPVPVTQLAAADEVFITSTTTEVMPVTTLDGKPVGTGRPGPVTQRMWQAFDAMVRKAAHWANGGVNSI